ncbi:MAG: septum formation initiator family protein [Cyclobacteriaceae bacterium]
MKRVLKSIPPFFRNFYFLGALFFIAWLLFFDSNDLITQVKLSKKEAELEKTRDFYQEEIKEVKEDREALLNNEDLLEKVAREKYFMKKEGEEVFVVVEEEEE